MTISGARAGVERGDEHHEAEEQREEPEAGDPPRRRVREHLGDPHRGDDQRDRQRQDPHAGLDRGEPERDREEQRHREEQPGLEQVLEEERSEPAAQEPDPQDRRIEQRRAAGVAAVLLPLEEPEQHHAAAQDQPDHGRQAQPGGRVRLRLHEPPRPGAEDPVDDEAEAERRERGADEVEARALLLRGVRRTPVQQQHDPDDEHLADEDVAPRPVGREEPADQRADRDGDRAARHHEAVGAGRSGVTKFDATSATIAGITSAAPTPSRNDQPNSSTARLGDKAVVSDPHP